jgi:hypothetical protein
MPDEMLADETRGPAAADGERAIDVGRAGIARRRFRVTQKK